MSITEFKNQSREKSPLERAMEDFNHLKDDLAATKAREQQLKDMNVGLLQENAMLRERSEKVEGERDKYKAYAYELGTRLEVINETIRGAMAYASDAAFGTKEAIKKKEEKPKIVQINSDDPESVEARALIARLPASANKFVGK